MVLRPLPQALGRVLQPVKSAGDAHEARRGTASVEAMLGEEVPAPGDSQHVIKVGAAHRLLEPPLADSPPDQLHRFALTGHDVTPAVPWSDEP